MHGANTAQLPLQCFNGTQTYKVVVTICVTAQGTVSGVKVTRRSIPYLDQQLPEVISRWTFKPYLVEGKPTPFCDPLLYTLNR